ncbi:MAG: HAD family hydrolase [Calditrichaceae bacterium]
MDGTLANNEGKISQSDLLTLHKLGSKGIKRVIATGRNLFSAKKILNETMPIDFLIFSSGAGIYDWHKREIIKSSYLKSDEIKYIYQYLQSIDTDFMMHYPIPENHRFFYYVSGKYNPDFEHRLSVYKDFAERINQNKFKLTTACQFVAVIPDVSFNFGQVADDLVNFSVIRTTSPFDKKTLWIEIFPAGVSKGKSAAWLCHKLNISSSGVLSIGNDYNDLDLLNWSGNSYVVDNAPHALKRKFTVTRSNQDSAFMQTVKKFLLI